MSRLRRATVALFAGWLALPCAADYDDGLYAMDIGDYATAFAEFARAAAQGDMRAANLLGELYERGDGVDRDPVRAAEWYRRAAEAGNREAQYNYAGMFRSGEGVPLDAELSMLWYQRAADQGLAIAQFFVAKNHEHGQGVPQDLAEAWAWYSLAAVNGDSGSAKNRDRVAAFLDETQAARAVGLLREHAAELELTAEQYAELGIPADEPGPATGGENAPPVIVAAIQQALVDLGYEVGSVDGVAGPRTRRALSEFAQSVGMLERPRLGTELLDRLHATLAGRRAAAEVLEDAAVAEVAGSDGAAAAGEAAAPPVPAPTPPAPAPVDDAVLAASPEIRQRLSALGYESVDDGENALRALRAFRRDAGLPADGSREALVETMDRLTPAAAAAPGGNALVRAVQAALAALGHDPGPADGVMGGRTRAAIAAFAAAAGYGEPPRVTAVLLARLQAAAGVDDTLTAADTTTPAPAPGPVVEQAAPPVTPPAAPPAPTGRDLVRAVQGRLAELGYEPGPVDGLLGSRTRAAARAFRADRGLAGGDAVDADLLARLEAVRAATTPPTTAGAISPVTDGAAVTPEPATGVSAPATTKVPAAPDPAARVESAVDAVTPGIPTAPQPPAAAVGEEDPVSEAQRLLAGLGFDVGAADGIAGTRTRNAVLAFERANGFTGNGRIDEALLERLRAAATGTAPAPDGDRLAEVQRRLVARGYRPGDADGAMGALMRQAIEQFQRDEGLAVTGEADLPTLARLRRAPAPVRADVAMIRAVQAALAARGHDPGPADGAAGPRTRAAMAAFRAAEGLPPAEQVDVALLRRLGIGP